MNFSFKMVQNYLTVVFKYAKRVTELIDNPKAKRHILNIKVTMASYVWLIDGVKLN